MQKKYIVIILLSAIVYSACHKRSMTASNKDNSIQKDNVENTSEIKNVIIDPKTDMTVMSTYNLDSMTVKDDILSLFVNYSGGCKEHSFELYSNGMYAKSLPPQIAVILKHDNNNDTCRELIKKELKFNIAQLKFSTNKTVIVKCADKRISYTIK